MNQKLNAKTETNPEATRTEVLQKKLTIRDLEQVAGGARPTKHKVCDSGGYCDEWD